MSRRQQNGINIPGIILDELKEKDYSNDERFNGSMKRGSSKQIGRKDRRKQQRVDKKLKQRKTNSTNKEDITVKKEVKKDNKHPKNEDKNHNRKKQDEKPKEKLPFSSDDELSSGDFDEFDEGDLDEEEWKQLKGLEGDEEEEDDQSDMDSEEMDHISEVSEDDDDGDEQELTPEETMAKLKALKDKKNNKNNKKVSFTLDTKSVDEEDEDGSDEEMTVEETMKALKAKKESKKKESKDIKRKEKEEEEYYPLPPSEHAAIERDEMDMQYYAKKLKLKGKRRTLMAEDEFDAVGGLLDGLDFMDNYGASDEEYGEYAIDEKKTAQKKEKAPESDDDISSDDYDDFDENDLNEEEWAQLRELEEDDDEDEDSGDEDEDSGDEDSHRKKPRENPYVAAVSAEVDEGGAYIPPSLRKAMLKDQNNESATTIEIKKKVKSSLNKLSDSNITSIISSLGDLFDSYPRQTVTETITKEILDTISQKNKLLDSYIMNFAGVAFALFKIRGVELGAYFIQTIVEAFLNQFDIQLKNFESSSEDEVQILPKECSNLLTLLSYSYDFGFISCRLLYDLIHIFVEKPNLVTTELLLRIVSVSGQLIRGDDPTALKEIISELLKNVKDIKEPSPRLQFLLNTMSDLKNNRLKPSILATDFHPLKKLLSSTFKGVTSSMEPLQVTLDDIKNIETKGKWWLVGSSWKGNMNSAFEEGTQKSSTSQITTNISIEDDLLDDLPDWSQIAKENRMNTDVRRAIFISIMSAQDYVNAFEKLEKLGLRNKQILEIPRVLLSCLQTDSKDNGYNPYYSFVASKACEQHHNLLKSFQFLFWDTVKKFEEDNDSDSDDDLDNDIDDESLRLRSIANQGKFFGHLLGEGILKLDSFKHVPLMGGLSTDGNLFIEVLLYQFFQTLGKKCETSSKKDGKKIFTYKEDSLYKFVKNGLNIDGKSIILKGIKWFIDNKFKYENYLSEKGSKAYQREKRRMEWIIPNFIELIDNETEGSEN